MSSKSKGKAVVAGEASESEDDESSADDAVIANKEVIQGEAVESDDEDDQLVVPPLQVEQGTVGDALQEEEKDDVSPTPVVTEETTKVEKPKYDTLLHKKLRERNVSLYKNLGEYMSVKYTNNTKDVKEITKSLSKSQLVIQNVSHQLRLLTNDLFQLEDRIGLVTSSDILPAIDLHNKPPL